MKCAQFANKCLWFYYNLLDHFQPGDWTIDSISFHVSIQVALVWQLGKKISDCKYRWDTPKAQNRGKLFQITPKLLVINVKILNENESNRSILTLNICDSFHVLISIPMVENAILGLKLKQNSDSKFKTFLSFKHRETHSNLDYPQQIVFVIFSACIFGKMFWQILLQITYLVCLIMFSVKVFFDVGELTCTSDSLFASRILKELRVNFITRQLNVSYHWTTNKTILHRSKISKSKRKLIFLIFNFLGAFLKLISF